MNSTDAIKKLLVGLSAYYQMQIPDVALNMYAEDLCDLHLEDLGRAILEYRRNPKNTRFPLPAALRAILTPSIDDESQAREISARIVSAVSKFGWPNPSEARDYIGEVGWSVVNMQGGWPDVCQILDERNLGQMQAQWRDLALSALKRSKLSGFQNGPYLENKNQEPKQIERREGLVQFGSSDSLRESVTQIKRRQHESIS